ncbi:MAG: ABC transporter ATP-binding protein [candidate division WOR-3 bacterium]|nr:ABC transporter ATP-binding protein [candidate division WOR-3 bacterium]
MFRIRDLRFAYAKRDVVQIETLDIPRRGLFAIVGPNGAGKSTLIKIIAGILKNYRGSIVIDSRELSDYSAAQMADMRSYVPQDTAVHFGFTVEQFIEFGQYRRMGLFTTMSASLNDRLIGTVKQLELDGLRHKSISEISGGELQKTHIARALFQDSGIMLLDEPVSSIDIHHKYEIMKFLRKLSKDKLILYVTHDIVTALNFSDRIIALKEGALIDIKRPSDMDDTVKALYGNTFTIEEIRDNYVIIEGDR